LLVFDRVVGGRVGVLVGRVVDLGPVVRDPHVHVQVHVRVLAVLLVLQVLGVHQIDLFLKKFNWTDFSDLTLGFLLNPELNMSVTTKIIGNE
jgi:hypothetical protein